MEEMDLNNVRTLHGWQYLTLPSHGTLSCFFDVDCRNLFDMTTPHPCRPASLFQRHASDYAASIFANVEAARS